MKSDNILSKIFPQNILGKNLGKFAAKEFLDDLHLDTLIKNLKTGDKDRIKSILQNNDFLEIQLLDYAGHLHLVEGVSEFKIGNSINTLFVKSEEDSLIMHKLRLVRYLRNFKINDAFTEFQIIQAMQNDKVDKFTEFRVLCLKGRMLLRQRKYQESLNSFDLAFSLLELRFTLNERQQLIIDRVNRNKPIFQAPNWDSIIVDYDEIALYYYYAVTLYLMDDYDITQINSLLDNAEKLAVKYDSLIDKLNILHLKSEILVDLKNYTKAINNLQKGLSIMKLSKLINENILLFSDFHNQILEAYCYTLNFSSAQNLLEDLAIIIDNEPSTALELQYLNSLILYHTHKNTIVDSYNDLKRYISFVSSLNYSIADVDPLFIAENIFRYIIQGLVLEKIPEDSEIIQLIEVLNQMADSLPIIHSYIELINIQIVIRQMKGTSTSSQIYKNILHKFEKLMDDYHNERVHSVTIICHFMYYLATQINMNTSARDDIVSLSVRGSEILISSSYVIAYLKIEIIKNIVKNTKLDPIIWLKGINEIYDLHEIETIIAIVKNFGEGNIDLQELIKRLFYNEVYFDKFQIYEDEPISVMMKRKSG